MWWMSLPFSMLRLTLDHSYFKDGFCWSPLQPGLVHPCSRPPGWTVSTCSQLVLSPGWVDSGAHTCMRSVCHCCCCSVAQSRLTLCNPMDSSPAGSLSFTVSWNLLKLISIESVVPANYLILCCPLLLCPQSFPASGSYPVNRFFTSGGQSIGVSASTSVLPVNVQGWFPLGLTDLISLLSKGHSRIFCSTTVHDKNIENSEFMVGTLFFILHIV